MSSTFSLVIVSAPQTSQGSLSAYHFAKALLKKNHSLLRVFFYSDGATHGMMGEIPQDEFNVHEAWQHLAEEYHFELAVCSGSFFRRGGTPETAFIPPFQLKGLTALSESYLHSDKVIVFGS